jgi:hypothetical protein
MLGNHTALAHPVLHLLLPPRLDISFPGKRRYTVVWR